MSATGVPGALLPLVIATEVLGAIAIIVGWNTRITAFLLAGIHAAHRVFLPQQPR
jgi:putative oxidoreductase